MEALWHYAVSFFSASVPRSYELLLSFLFSLQEVSLKFKSSCSLRRVISAVERWWWMFAFCSNFSL